MIVVSYISTLNQQQKKGTLNIVDLWSKMDHLKTITCNGRHSETAGIRISVSVRGCHLEFVQHHGLIAYCCNHK